MSVCGWERVRGWLVAVLRWCVLSCLRSRVRFVACSRVSCPGLRFMHVRGPLSDVSYTSTYIVLRLDDGNARKIISKIMNARGAPSIAQQKSRGAPLLDSPRINTKPIIYLNINVLQLSEINTVAQQFSCEFVLRGWSSSRFSTPGTAPTWARRCAQYPHPPTSRWRRTLRSRENGTRAPAPLPRSPPGSLRPCLWMRRRRRSTPKLARHQLCRCHTQ